MVNAQAECALPGDDIQHQRVRGAEDFLAVAAQCRQRRDIKESAVVDLIGGDAPVGQAIRLRGEQRIERIKAACFSRSTVQPGQGIRDGAGDLGMIGQERADPPLDDFLLAMSFGDTLALALGVHRQVADRGENALEFECGLVLRSQRVDDRLGGGFENRPVAFRVKRKTVVVVLDVETAAFHLQTQFSLLENLTEKIAKDRDQNAAPILGTSGGGPIDIKVPSIRR